MNVEKPKEKTSEKLNAKERTLSCFFCRELFPLYIEEKLDVHRREQIEKHISTCASCRHLLDKITFSQTVLKELSETKPTESLVSYIRKEQSFWSETFEKIGWGHWPSTLQWAVQLSLIAVILVTGIHFFPWLKLARGLRQIQRKAAPLVTAPATNVVASDDDTPKPAEEPKAKPFTVDSSLYGPAIPEALRQATETPSVETGNAPAAAKDDQQPGSSKMAGFVWKGTLKVDSISDEIADRVTKAVIDLGGVKAGQVELGWHRGDQRYYHFILPEDNYDRLLSALNREGIVILTKESHPRVIKQGHMRIIMTIEENE